MCNICIMFLKNQIVGNGLIKTPAVYHLSESAPRLSPPPSQPSNRLTPSGVNFTTLTHYKCIHVYPYQTLWSTSLTEEFGTPRGRLNLETPWSHYWNVDPLTTSNSITDLTLVSLHNQSRRIFTLSHFRSNGQNSPLTMNGITTQPLTCCVPTFDH